MRLGKQACRALLSTPSSLLVLGCTMNPRIPGQANVTHNIKPAWNQPMSQSPRTIQLHADYRWYQQRLGLSPVLLARPSLQWVLALCMFPRRGPGTPSLTGCTRCPWQLLLGSSLRLRSTTLGTQRAAGLTGPYSRKSSHSSFPTLTPILGHRTWALVPSVLVEDIVEANAAV